MLTTAAPRKLFRVDYTVSVHSCPGLSIRFFNPSTISSAASTAVGKDEDFVVFVDDVKAAKDWKTST
jgi:hypothetical protein